MTKAACQRSEIVIERKWELVICQLEAAYTSLEYYKDSEKKENLRILITERSIA